MAILIFVEGGRGFLDALHLQVGNLNLARVDEGADLRQFLAAGLHEHEIRAQILGFRSFFRRCVDDRHQTTSVPDHFEALGKRIASCTIEDDVDVVVPEQIPTDPTEVA